MGGVFLAIIKIMAVRHMSVAIMAAVQNIIAEMGIDSLKSMKVH